ncbi:MAG: hypothetical protein FWH12_00305 [Treponema sp.]|nr:hypothetical protein [Treponema sp.]
MTKPSATTSLSGDRRVPKTHGRIVFRGVIDSLQAECIEVQVLAAEQDLELCARFGEILDYLRAIMVAEVKDTPLSEPFLFGMEAEEIHRASQTIERHLPSYTQGALAAQINSFRAKVRAAELSAIRVFSQEESEPGVYPRDDIPFGLNRLSSALWWLFCDHVAKLPKTETAP